MGFLGLSFNWRREDGGEAVVPPPFLGAPTLMDIGSAILVYLRN